MESHISSFSQDIKNLIHTFLQKRSLAFSDFKQTWKDLGFSLIFEGKWEAFSLSEYTQLLFSTTLGYFHVNSSFPVRVAVIYTLYLLHETQHAPTKDKIVVSLAVWEEIVKFVEQVQAARLVELYQILVKMKQEGYWCFASLPPSNIEAINLALSAGGTELSPFFPDAVLNVDTINGVVDLPVLENVSEDYQQVKEELAEGGISEHVNQSSLAVVNSRLLKDVQELLAHHNEEKSQIFRSFGLPVPDVHSLHKAKSLDQKSERKISSQKSTKQNKTMQTPKSNSKKQIDEPDLFSSITFSKTPALFSGLNLPFANFDPSQNVTSPDNEDTPQTKRAKA